MRKLITDKKQFQAEMDKLTDEVVTKIDIKLDGKTTLTIRKDFKKMAATDTKAALLALIEHLEEKGLL